MPERQEDDRFDGEELENRVERPQEVLGAKVEKKEGVQGQRDGNVVNEGDVEVALVWVPIAVFIETVRLQPDGDKSHDGLDNAKLKGGLKKKMLIKDPKTGHPNTGNI